MTHELLRGIRTPEGTLLPAGTRVRVWPGIFQGHTPLVPTSGPVEVGFVHPTMHRIDRPAEWDWSKRSREEIFRGMPIGGGYLEKFLIDVSNLKELCSHH